MTDIADIGRRHLADALTGKMYQCTVSEWLDENGVPVELYWKPLTGKQQREIDQAQGEVNRVCMLVKLRALDADGKQVFKDVSLSGLANDYDYDVIRTIAYIIAGNIGQDTDPVENAEKE